MRVLLAHALNPKRRRIARLLEQAGHEVFEVGDCDDAVEACIARRPDVAVLDARLCPAAVSRIKSHPDAYRVAVILLQPADLCADAAQDALREGVQDFLVEPVRDGEGLARVEAAARTKELQQELVAQGGRLGSPPPEDALTGLLTRRPTLTPLGGSVPGARRHGHPLSVAMVD